MTYRACVQLLLDIGGIDASINIQMLKTPHYILFHLEDLGNGINPEIVTLKKYRGGVFSECCIDIFKVKFLRCVNEFLFEMV